MEAAKIVLLAVCAAVLYGIAHDMVTARIASSTSRRTSAGVRDAVADLLALGWGTIATWWVGLPLARDGGCRAAREFAALASASCVKPIAPCSA
jgi:hypothetical protein